MPISSASTMAGIVMRRATHGAPTTARIATSAEIRIPGASRRTVIAMAGAVVTEASAMGVLRPASVSGTAIELGQRVLAVAERLGRGEAAVGGAHHHLDQCVACLRDRH